MAVFEWVESPGTQANVTFRVAATKFGDGYEERAPDGLNPINREWPLSFVDIDDAVADEIQAFLEARVTAVSGLETFDWWPVWQPATVKVKCTAYTRSLGTRPGESTINATFVRVYVA